jgi:hypothetical protein
MKRSVFMVTLLVLCVGQSLGQPFPNVSLRQIQEVPIDSLHLLDSLQGTPGGRWTLQTSPYLGDTVTVTALCVVQPKVLTFTACGFTMILYDTGAFSSWGAILVRVNSPQDTAQIILDGFLNVERGDIVTMTGIVQEFPTGLPNSVTQFQPVAGIPISIVGVGPVPPPVPKEISDFATGIFPATTRVRYSTGEPYESVIVYLTNSTVDFRVNTARGTFSMVDDNAVANQITDYDGSRYFTLGGGHGSTCPMPADSVWQALYPVVGTRVDTIRGYITTVSGSENPRGYRISPVYYGDFVRGVVLPSVFQHRRNPIIVPPDSAARISVRATQQAGGNPIATVDLIYSLNNSPFTTVAMTFQSSDSTYNGQIPQQPVGTNAHYFIKATDTQGFSKILASSASGGAASDTAFGFFFYTVHTGPMSIQGLQYTPYQNGRSPYIAAQVSVSGVVTADTASIGITPLTTGGTSSWYMQTGSEPWNGLWIVGPESTMALLHNGDSITVNGFVDEQFDVTRVENIAFPVSIHTGGNPEPAIPVRTTGTFGPTIGNGNPAAEQWESMLLRFNNVVVTDTFPTFADPTEFAVDDGTGPILVRRDGRHRYSNQPPDTVIGKTILRVGDTLAYIQGVIYYSFNRYKVVPRTDADFAFITGIGADGEPGLPEQYSLEQNYPNPFNPVTLIKYSLPVGGEVTLKIFNLLGQEVKTLVHESQPAGRYTAKFDGSSHASGVYFYRIQVSSGSKQGDQFRHVRKMVLVK